MLIFSSAVIAALFLSGRAKNMDANDWLAVAVALVGVNLCRGGNWFMGGGLIAGAMFWSGAKIFGRKPKQANIVRKAGDFELDRARALLGVTADADHAAINKAWRASLTEHHPDRGGDEDLARQINRARDILLENITANSPR